MGSAEQRLRVVLVQQSGRSESVRDNLADLLASIDQAAADGGADYVLATELSLTPYFCGSSDDRLREWAETVPGAAIEALGEKARQHGLTIIAPFYLREPDGRHYNSAVVIGPDGRLVPGELPGGGSVPYFSKVHLPQVATDNFSTDEKRWFTPGTEFPIFRTAPGPRIGLLICYDRRFPEAWRALVLAGAEIIFMPACVPAWDAATAASSAEMFVAELRTRACENLVFVVACNRAGYEQFRGVQTLFFGQSCIIGPGGGLIAQGLANAPCLVRGTVDMEELERARARLPLLRDRRPELYSRK